MGMGQALLQPCIEFVGKIRLCNVHLSGLFKFANGKKPNSNCWGPKRNIGARVPGSSGEHLLHLGLGLGVQQGQLNSLSLPSPSLAVLLSFTLASLQTGRLPGCLPAASGKHFLSAFLQERERKHLFPTETQGLT